MILKEKEVDVVVSGNFKETSFSIEQSSEHIIFDMLRSKIYKNNIAAICREVACNSRDAQRENGDYITQIEIEISDKRDSFFYEDGLNIIFRDRGTGISPDKVENIYVKYGASTKRNSNSMTGGFGLGSKTPFSYADAFTVRTIVDGIEYVYSIYIDVTKKGKMALLFKQPIDHVGNMTEVIIPIKGHDLHRFETEVLKNTHFWPIRPKLLNFNTNYYKFNLTSQSFGSFAVEKKDDYFIIDKTGFIESHVNVIIDGVYYPVDMKIIGYEFGYCNFAICFIYENGVLNISSNRETLQYDKDTINSIKSKIEMLFLDFKEQYITSINDAKNLYTAQWIYNDAKIHNDLFEVMTKTNSFEYNMKGAAGINTGEVVLIDKIGSWKPSSMRVFLIQQATPKLEIDSIYKRRIEMDDFYLVFQNDNYSHNNRLSVAINRTIAKNGVAMVFVEDLSDDVDETFAQDNEDDKKMLSKLGITCKDYWSVVPDKIKVGPRKKREYVILKTFIRGCYDRVNEFEYNDGFFHYHSNKLSNIYYFSVVSEKSISDDLKNALMELSSIMQRLEPGCIISICSNLKKRMFKNYLPIEEIIHKYSANLKPFIFRFILHKEIMRVEEYKNISFDASIKDRLSYLYDLEITELCRLQYFLPFLKNHLPSFDINHEFDYSVFEDIKIKYPLINVIDGGNININNYINIVNELNNYRQLNKI